MSISPTCGATAVFWPDDEQCDAECMWPVHSGTTHKDEVLGEWTEDELYTTVPKRTGMAMVGGEEAPFMTVDQAVVLHEGIKLAAASVELGPGFSLVATLALPPCPVCKEVPAEVRQRDSVMLPGVDVAFMPCGHRFAIGGAAMQAIYVREMQPDEQQKATEPMATRSGKTFSMTILDDPIVLWRKQGAEQRKRLRDWYATAVRVGDLSVTPLREEGFEQRARNDALEAVGLPHDCFCRCPVDGGALYYSTVQRVHACQNAECVHASGIELPGHG